MIQNITKLREELQSQAQKTTPNSITPNDVFNNMRDILDTSANNVQEIEYAQLKELRDGGNLCAGRWYRITDYICTVQQDGFQSAEYQFDILVLATSANTLNETAFAARHAGDDYFPENVRFDAWQLKYCLDNDKNRFGWAMDDENGRGVVYFMRDENGNEAPFDFKSVQMYDEEKETLFYAFSIYNEESGEMPTDGSLTKFVQRCKISNAIGLDLAAMVTPNVLSMNYMYCSGEIQSVRILFNNEIICCFNNPILAESNNVIANGFNNKIIGGLNNIIKFGDYNTIEGNSGYNKIINGGNNFIKGSFSNEILVGNNNVIINGERNTIRGFNNVIMDGNRNTIEARSNVIYGSDNHIKKSHYNTIKRGNYNTITGEYDSYHGSNYILQSDNNIIRGHNNIIQNGDNQTLGMSQSNKKIIRVFHDNDYSGMAKEYDGIPMTITGDPEHGIYGMYQEGGELKFTPNLYTGS